MRLGKSNSSSARRNLTGAILISSILSGCSWLPWAKEEIPVAVPPPALPSPPRELLESSAMTLQTLRSEFEEAWGDFLRELRESFDAARKPNPSPTSAETSP